MNKPSLIRVYLLFLLSLLSFTAWMPVASAYEQYSVDRNTGNCADCHGNFRANPYTSLADGVSWNDDLHDVHRSTMLSGDCNTCHQASGRFPVLLDLSAGGINFDPISCTGCHGRAETQAGGQVTGAGLRQHHWNSGETICADCHSDADPAAFTAVSENVSPSYYFTPDTNHPNKPTDPCNPNGEENYAGSAIGLDNDGDMAYDQNDSDCQAMIPDINLNPAALDFGAVVMGNSVTLSSQIENLGNADLTVTDISPAAGTSTEFSVTAPATPFTIAAGGSQSVTVIYTPADVGADTGSLVISSDDPDEPTVSLALSGSGEMAPTPDINLSPAALDFGSVFIGNTANLSTEVQNLGTADLTVSVIDRCAGTSMEFSWTPGAPITLAAGASQTLTVSYSPVDVGTDTGCLAITSNDPDEASVELGLSGSGVEPGQVKEVQIKVPDAIKPANKGVTPIKFFADMDLEIMDVVCGRNDAMPKRLNSEDINDDGYLDVVGLFKTRDLGVQCGDTQLSCNGTLAGGTEFQGTSNSFKTVGKACKKDEHEDNDDDDDKDGERHKDDND